MVEKRGILKSPASRLDAWVCGNSNISLIHFGIIPQQRAAVPEPT